MESNVNQNLQQQNPIAPILTVKDWMLTMLLLAIPVVNLIMLFVWAFGGGANPSKANYAKAGLLWAAIAIVLYFLVAVLFLGSIFAGLKTGMN
ncbi:hypothetical protein [Paenibacillus sp. UNC451MF]|uniref:hypothetical protein n=1 Tax=Paenibacillus sp. UNC451MF TaxID=1449063 RepID=UPI00048A83CE|nr:hypothetical protein [Paenibacillus sp. UNC451MF]